MRGRRWQEGHDGLSCAETIGRIVTSARTISFSELRHELNERRTWSDDNIKQQVMACIVNLPPARRWANTKPMLFVRPDGQFEMFDPGAHPGTIE